MDQNITTVRTQAADIPTAKRMANNKLAIAIARYSRTQSEEDRLLALQAREEVEELNRGEIQGRRALLSAVSERMQRS